MRGVKMILPKQMETIDKVVMINVLFRLSMIRGKTIIFVNNVDKGYKYVVIIELLIVYLNVSRLFKCCKFSRNEEMNLSNALFISRLRMYLGQFGINSCVLNSEMPVASRCHIVEQFNSGKYDIIIASDEQSLEDPKTSKSKDKKG